MTDHDFLTRKQFFAGIAQCLSDLDSEITITVSSGIDKRHPTLRSVRLTPRDTDRISVAVDHPCMDLPSHPYTYQDAVDIVRGFITLVRARA